MKKRFESAYTAVKIAAKFTINLRMNAFVESLPLNIYTRMDSRFTEGAITRYQIANRKSNFDELLTSGDNYHL